jgi:hypothetical protein
MYERNLQMSAKNAELDLGTLWGAIDDATGGALYTLRFECGSNSWQPHLWAQTSDEGAPPDHTRLIFLGVDPFGRTQYFDTAIVADPHGMAERIKATELVQDAARAEKRVREGLTRMDCGLDPDPYADEHEAVARALN